MVEILYGIRKSKFDQKCILLGIQLIKAIGKLATYLLLLLN